MYKSVPTYDDLRPQDDSWTPAQIYSLEDDGLSNAEIALELDINMATVRKYLDLRYKNSSERFFNETRKRRWAK